MNAVVVALVVVGAVLLLVILCAGVTVRRGRPRSARVADPPRPLAEPRPEPRPEPRAEPDAPGSDRKPQEGQFARLKRTGVINPPPAPVRPAPYVPAEPMSVEALRAALGSSTAGQAGTGNLVAELKAIIVDAEKKPVDPNEMSTNHVDVRGSGELRRRLDADSRIRVGSLNGDRWFFSVARRSGDRPLHQALAAALTRAGVDAWTVYRAD